jgi:hypothetical protein
MLADLIGAYDWVLDPVITYSTKENLLKGFKRGIIDRAWQKHKELQSKKTAVTLIKTKSMDDFINSESI